MAKIHQNSPTNNSAISASVFLGSKMSISLPKTSAIIGEEAPPTIARIMPIKTSVLSQHDEKLNSLWKGSILFDSFASSFDSLSGFSSSFLSSFSPSFSISGSASAFSSSNAFYSVLGSPLAVEYCSASTSGLASSSEYAL